MSASSQPRLGDCSSASGDALAACLTPSSAGRRGGADAPTEGKASAMHSATAHAGDDADIFAPSPRRRNSSLQHDAVCRSSDELSANVVEGRHVRNATSHSPQRMRQTSQHSLKSCLKVKNSTDFGKGGILALAPYTQISVLDDAREEALSAPAATPPAAANPTLSKSVHISEDLPRRKDARPYHSDADSPLLSFTTSSPSSSASGGDATYSSPISARLVRRNAAHRRVASSDIRFASHSSGSLMSERAHNSAESVRAMGESEDDDENDRLALATPLDENGPRFPAGSPPTNAMSDDAADRQDQVSSDISDSILRLAQLRSPPVRRSSRAPKRATRHTSDTTPHDAQDMYDGRGDPASLQSDSVMAPTSTLMNAILLDIGRQASLTPPALSRSSQPPTTSATAQNGSADVVNAALSMRGSVASSRFDRNTEESVSRPSLSEIKLNSFHLSGPTPTRHSKHGSIVENEGESKGRPGQPAPSRSNGDRVEVSYSELEREEAELNRRRTTGSLQARRSDERQGPVGRPRVHRTATQDPLGGRAFVGHSRTTSLATLADADAQPDAFRSRDSSPQIRARPFALEDATTTPVDTPSLSCKAFMSPYASHGGESASYITAASVHDYDMAVHGFGAHGRGEINASGRKFAVEQGAQASAANVLTGGLMGIGEVGHFGPGVRAKVAQLIASLIDTVPMSGEDGETISMCEFGAINSRSAFLLRPAVSALAKRVKHEEDATAKLPSGAKSGYFDGWRGKGSDGALAAEQQACRVTFCITHEDTPSSDFRPLTQILDAHSESYLDGHWQSQHTPCLTNAVFPTFAARPFAKRVAPPRSLHLGVSLMDLHWMHTPINTHVSTIAQAELTAFLNARANEFKQDGVLVLAYIARSDDGEVGGGQSSESSLSERSSLSSSSPTSSTGKPGAGGQDIWTTLSNILAPCIQRLVSCGMLKSDIARRLLDLPLHPRTAKQTRAALQSVEAAWKLEWSCGLGYDDDDNAAGTLRNEPQPLCLAHPAWKAYESDCLSRVPFTEHMIQLFKTLYEGHFRAVLRERGRLSKGAVEFVLDSLWDVLFSRIVDSQDGDAHAIKDVEIEVCVYALRRR